MPRSDLDRQLLAFAALASLATIYGIHAAMRSARMLRGRVAVTAMTRVQRTWWLCPN